MGVLSNMYPGDAVALLAVVVTVQIAVVVGAAWLVASLCARRLPARRHAIWLCALYAVLLTPVISWMTAELGLATWTIGRGRVTTVVAESSPGEYELPVMAPRIPYRSLPYEPGRDSAPQAAVPANETDIGTVGSREAEERRELTSDQGHAAPPSESTDVRSTPDTDFRVFGGALAAVWVIGLLVQVVRVLVGWAWVMRERRRATPVVEPWVLDLMTDIAAQVGLKHAPRLACRPRGVGPLVTGFWRPVILLPPRWLDEGNRESLRHVLLHELAHVVRGDVMIGLVQRLVAAVFWLHPLVHVLNRELSRAREETCDNYVLTAVEPSAFSETLLAFATQREALWPQPGIGLRSGSWRLEDRVAGLLDAGRGRATRIEAKAAAVGVAAWVTLVALMAGVSPGLAENRLTPSSEMADSSDAAGHDSPSAPVRHVVDEDSLPAEELRSATDETKPVDSASLVADSAKEPFAGDVRDAWRLLSELGAGVEKNDDGETIEINLTGTEVEDGHLQRLEVFTALRQISLSDTRISDAGAASLVHFPALETIDLSYTHVTDTTAALLADTTVQGLLLLGCDITDEATKHLQRMRYLNWLSLTNTRITDEGLRQLSRSRSLEYLDLGVDNITDEGMVHLARMRQLLQIHVDGSAVSDEGLAAIVRLPRLTRLNIRDTRITNAGLRHLRNHATLRELELPAAVTDAGLAHVATISGLRELVLYKTKVTDAGLRRLAALDQLHGLDLSYTQVGDAGVMALKACTSLENLSVRFTKVTPAGVAALARERPGLNIAPDWPPPQGVRAL